MNNLIIQMHPIILKINNCFKIINERAYEIVGFDNIFIKKDVSIVYYTIKYYYNNPFNNKQYEKNVNQR